MTDDLKERLLATKRGYGTSIWVDGARVNPDGPEAADHIETLESDLRAALKECVEWARQAGEAKGRLEGSEAAGAVDGWRERAEAAETLLCEVFAEGPVEVAFAGNPRAIADLEERVHSAIRSIRGEG